MPAFMRKGWALLLLLCITGIFLLFKHHTTAKRQRLLTLLQGVSNFSDSRAREHLGRACACPRCVTEGDPWFLAHFDKSMNPFLMPENNLSEVNYIWWKKLQRDSSDLPTYRTVVDELFKLFPVSNSFVEAAPDRCRTCAVVGNSGNLQGSKYGPRIDFNNVVIRMNGAPTKGYEKDVGVKTTLHLMYPESAVDLDDDTHLVLFPFKTRDLQWLISAFTTGSITFTYLPVKPKIRANKDLVMVLNPTFIKYVYEIWLKNNGRYPSTGFLGLMLAMHICDEVNVFGFGADQDGNWRHYWEALKNRKLGTGVHSGIQEYKLIEKLSEREKITFFRGN